MAGITKKLIYTILLSAPLFSAQLSYAADIPFPGEEASAAFLDEESDDDSVELFLSGSWQAEVNASAGFGWSAEDGFLSDSSYPGMETGLYFSQSPDFTASLNILDSFFFDASFTEDFTDSVFSLGYRGGEDDFLKKIYAGNQGLNIETDTGSRDYFYVPDGGPSSFGLYTLLSGESSSHEFLLRFDPDTELEKLYIGSDLVTEFEFEVDGYLRERFFYIPGTPDDAAIYLECSAEDDTALFSAGGRSFRPAESDEYSYSTDTGLLYLTSKPDGTVLVLSDEFTWSDTVDSPYLSSGEVLDDFSLSTPQGRMLAVNDRGDMDIITNPGLFSPFESAAAYSTGIQLPDDLGDTRIFLSSSAADPESGIELQARQYSSSGIVVLKPAASGSLKYPLSGLSGIDSEAYGPESAAAGTGRSALKIYIQVREPASAYSLDDPVEGTVRIKRNGFYVSDWTLEGSQIIFDTAPADDDRIEITYRKKSGGDTGGDLLAAAANRFDLGSGWSAVLNSGVRWNADSSSYALQGEEKSGFLGAEALLEYSNEEFAEGPLKLNASLSGGLKLETANSSGTLLIGNMSDSGLSVSLSRNTVFPSSVPGSLGLSAADRGLLIYRDYRITNSSLSWTLQDYTADLSADMVFSPDESTAADRYKAGPYTAAAAADGKSGEVLVMDYELDSAGKWVGVQIPVSRGSGNLDLSGYRALSFDWKSDGALSGVELYIEIGCTGEDLDADGILDEETGEWSSGFIFNDPVSEGGTLVGGDNIYGSNSILDSEDINGNGFLDRESSDLTACYSTDSGYGNAVTIAGPGTGWQRTRLYFTGDGASDRTRLKDAEFIRITAVGTSAASGRILFDDFRFEGAPFHHSSSAATAAPSFSAAAEDAIRASDKPSSALTADYQVDDDNDVLNVSWADSWELYSYISPVSAADYENIVFYYHLPYLSAGADQATDLQFTLTDSDGLGIHADIPVSTTQGWKKVRIVPSRGLLYIDEELQSGSAVSLDSGAGSLVKMQFAVAESSSGRIYIDEISLNGSVPVLSTGLSASFSADNSAALFTAGDLEILGPSSFTADFSSDFSGFSDVYGNTAVPDSDIRLTAAADTVLLGSRTSASIQFDDISGSAELAASHRIDIPLAGSILQLTDRFSADNVNGGNYSRLDSLKLSTGLFNGNAVSFFSEYYEGQLTSEWSSDLGLTLQPFSLDYSFQMRLDESSSVMEWTDYFDGWYRTLETAFLSGSGELIERKTALELIPELKTTPVGAAAGMSAETSVDSDGIRNCSVSGSLSFPMSFGEGLDAFTIETGYTREAEFSLPGSSDVFTSGFAGDISAFGGLMTTQSLLWSSVPGVELFSADMPQLFFNECTAGGVSTAGLINTFFIRFNRNPGSRIFDLFIPGIADISIKRDISKDYSDLADSLDLDLRFSASALNLFGNAGIIPIFDFYFSDELNWAIDVLVTDTLSSLPGQEYSVDAGLTVYGLNDDTFSLDGTVFIPVNITDSSGEAESSAVNSSAVYIWNLIPETPFDIPIFTETENMMQVITNEEKLSLGFDEVFSTELKHTSSLIIPQSLTLSAFISAGFSIDSGSDTDVYLFGASIGISGSVFY